MWRKEARIWERLWDALMPGGSARCHLSTSSGENFSLQGVISQNGTDSCGGVRLQKWLSFSV